MDSLRRAAEHLPHVDAIGGSAAGVYVDNQVRFASLFRGVAPDAVRAAACKNMFRDLKRAWNGVPFDVVNDGDVTALLGSMSLHEGGVLGIALGTSTAGGYVTADGRITPWLNEIAFVPIDYRPDAPRDEWSGDLGCCVQYLSQQAVGRLLAPAHIERAAVACRCRRAQGAAGADAAGRPARRATSTRRWASTSATRSRTWRTSTTSARAACSAASRRDRAARSCSTSRARCCAPTSPSSRRASTLRMPGEKEKRHGQAIAAASLPARDESAVLGL